MKRAMLVLMIATLPAYADEESVTVESLPPVVVKTIPESGTTDVDASLKELRATFSKPMIDGNWSWVQVSKETFPKNLGKPRFENDGRTCVLPVELEPGKTYVVWLNKGKFNSFMDKGSRRAIPYSLVFQTKGK